MQTKLIPLSKLELSQLNVRKTASKTADAELMASMVAVGLINPLTVIEQKGGKFHVIAGGRRLKAMQALQKDGELPAALKDGIPCQLAANDDAAELSLAENVVRQAMHPADEFEAFARLVADGASVTDVALRFGVSERHVKGRMAMARLDKAIIKAFRDGDLKLDQVMAFTITDDKKKQKEVLQLVQGDTDADEIRDTLTEEMIGNDSSIAKFVGVKEYEKNGGKTRSDLFGDEVYYEDPILLQKLAKMKLENVADSLKGDGWGWVEIVVENYWEIANRMTRIWDKNPTKEEKALMGCILSIDHDGKADVHAGYVRKEDGKAYMALKPKAAETQTVKQGKEPGAMPDSLRRSLEAFRLQVAEVAIAQTPELAYDLLVFSTASSILSRYYQSAIDISFRNQKPFTGEVKETVAATDLDDKLKLLCLSWLDVVDADDDDDAAEDERTEAERFAAFQKLKPEQKADILAYCVALTLKPSLAPETPDNASALDLALSQTGTRVMDYWRPTVANYLGRITTAQLLEIGTEIFGQQWAHQRKGDKKGQVAAELEAAFAKPEKAAGGNQAITVKLMQWMPKGMEFALPELAADDKRAEKAKKTAA